MLLSNDGRRHAPTPRVSNVRRRLAPPRVAWLAKFVLKPFNSSQVDSFRPARFSPVFRASITQQQSQLFDGLARLKFAITALSREAF